MKNILDYKGYYGSVEASPADGVLFGKVEFINSLISYQGATVPEIVKAFHEAVDEYLADCKESGVEPEKPFKGSFNVRIGHELHQKAAIVARERGISLNDFTKQVIEEAVC
jgi:predicted HicB family RNase H-like nuclease